MNELKTINEVCKMLDMTSRTIRYYEQFGLIKTVRESNTDPRRLDAENIERLRKIRFLKKLGLSLGEVALIIDSDEKASEMICRKNEELKAEIRTLMERIVLIEEVLAAAENGDSIYLAEQKFREASDDSETLRIAAECTRLLVNGRFSGLKPYLNADMKRQPPEFWEMAWNAHTAHCGRLISVGEQSMDGHTVINKLYYEKLGVIVRVDIYQGIVCGIVLQHFKLSRQPYQNNL